jgi:hypothetical protein
MHLRKKSPRTNLLNSWVYGDLYFSTFSKINQKMLKKYKRFFEVSSQSVTFLYQKIFFNNSFLTVVSRKDKKHIPKVVFIQILENASRTCFILMCVFSGKTRYLNKFVHFYIQIKST